DRDVRRPARLVRGPARPAAAGGVGPADRRQGSPSPPLPRAGAALLQQQGPPRPRRPHRPRGGVHRHLLARRGVPRAAPAPPRVLGLDAAGGRGGLSQGRRPGRDDGRRLPRCPRRRGRRRVRGPHVLPAPCRRADRARVVVRASRGVRRGRAPQRDAVLRRGPPGVAAHGRRPHRRAAGVGSRHPRRPGRARHARAVGVPGRRRGRFGTRRCRVRLRRHHHPAEQGRGDAAGPRRLHRAAGLGVAGARLARRRTRGPSRPPDERPHRLPRHRPPDGARGAPAGQEAAPRPGRLRRRLRRSSSGGPPAPGGARAVRRL
ncbi:MAG: tRNA (adenine(58)-N(1))-methyltransferase, partial [uncultured Nocardioidaceae bacterium]